MQHPFHLLPDMMVGPWKIKARLGAGGFGAVFRVEAGGQEYALKFAAHGPQSDDANRTDARARRELACLLLITHPNVVRVWAHGRWPHPTQGYHYVVMDYVEGPTLADWVKQARPTVRQVLRLFDTLALTLQALHSQGIHHRDLKGSNILVRASDGAPVLVDFGAAEHSVAGVPLTEGPLPPGTPHLRTPEALRFHREQYADPNAHYPFQPTDDLYALGATLYEVLTGSPPFPPSLPRDVLISLIETKMPLSPATLNPSVPPAVADLVLQLLAKRPEERPASGRALHEQLEALLREASPDLDMPLSPGSDTVTTEGMGGKPLTFSPDTPERPLPGPAEASEASAPTVLQQRASPGLSLRWHWSLAALVLLGLLVAGLWRLAGRDVAPAASVLLPPLPKSEPASFSADAGLAAHARASTDAGFPITPPLFEPPADARAPSPSLTEKGQSMRMKASPKKPSVPQEQEPARDGGSRHPALVGALACALVGGCATVPQGPPAEQQCPPGSVEAMQQLGLVTPLSNMVLMPGISPGSDWDATDVITVSEGRGFVTVEEERWKRVPRGSKLIGDFILRDRLYGRFTELQLPSGKRLPFCGSLASFERGEDGVTLRPGSEPGALKVLAVAFVYPEFFTH